MQPGRMPLESAEEYADRMQDYLKNIRMATAMIVVCTIKLEETAKILEDEYGLDFPEWTSILGGLEDVGEKTTNFIEDFIRAGE